MLNHENPFSSIARIEVVGMRYSPLSGWDTPEGMSYDLEHGSVEELILTEDYLQKLRYEYPFVFPRSLMLVDKRELERKYFTENEKISEMTSPSQVSPDLTKFSIRTREFLDKRVPGAPRLFPRDIIWRLYCWDNVEMRLHLIRELKSPRSSPQGLEIEDFSASGKTCLYSIGVHESPINVIHNLEMDSTILSIPGKALRVLNGVSYLIFDKEEEQFTAWSETGEMLATARTNAIPNPKSAYAITPTAFIVIGKEWRPPNHDYPESVTYTLDLKSGAVKTLGLTRVGAFVTKVIRKDETVTEDID